MAFRYCLYFMGMAVMQQRRFFIEIFIHTLIVVRLYTTRFLPLELFLPLMAALLVAQYIKQGFTPLVMRHAALLAVQAAGEILGVIQAQYLVAIVAVVLYFPPQRVYWLPKQEKTVGFREDSLEGGLHYYEFYPLEEGKEGRERQIKWHISKEIAMILQYKNINHWALRKLGQVVMSYVNKYRIRVADGPEKETDTGIAYCHGRGATPMMYSTILRHLAGEGFRVGASQHSEVRYTGYYTYEENKKFREKEVQVLAEEFTKTIVKVNRPKVVLMGHSYGCSTVIQAYHSLTPDLQQKVLQIVLLDPWFFALTEAKFKQEIKCPILILASQDQLRFPITFEGNSTFLAQHKAEYIVWKDAHHLHQSDMGFVGGNLQDTILNSHLSQLMIDLNLAALDGFLRGEKVEGTFGEYDLGRSYRPKQFHPEGVMVL